MVRRNAIGADKEKFWCYLDDESQYYEGGRKAINAMKNAGLISCLKSNNDGRIKLSYDVSEYQPLEECVRSLSVGELTEFIHELTKIIEVISDNGTLTVENTMLDMKYVYVSHSSGKLKPAVITLPLRPQREPGSSEELNQYFSFLRVVLQGAGAVDAEFRPLDEMISRSRSFSELENKLEEKIAESQDKPRGGGRKPAPEPERDSDPEPDPEPSEIVYENPRQEEKPVISRRMAIILIMQVLTIGLGVAAVVFIGWLGLIGVVLLDAVGVIIMLTVNMSGKDRDDGKKERKTRNKKKNNERDIESEFTGGKISTDTEPLKPSFVPRIRLIGENTPMPLVFVIDRETYRLGRETDNDGIIPDSLTTIGRHHCEIRTQGGQFIIVDHSSNGTKINNVAIPKDKPTSFKINDTLEFANYRFKVERQQNV